MKVPALYNTEPKSNPLKKLSIILWLLLLFGGISCLFWYNDLIYKLPTPVPANYKPIPTGQVINLPSQLHVERIKPVFLHFFNPDCPCSRFNMKHFRSLVKEYNSQVSFAIVVINNTRYNAKQVQEKFGLEIPVTFDTSLAAKCGVYSTPQAVILNRKHELYYRGNYNKSRYCTDKKTNYAQIALNTLLNEKPVIRFDQFALTAYGCQLPQCTK
jgi:hypothetical protein